MNNSNLHKAKKAANDEFYTRYVDVVIELRHYLKHFKNKVVYCNCDNPNYSAFWRFFHLNFAELGLKKIISTHLKSEDPMDEILFKTVYTDDVKQEASHEKPTEQVLKLMDLVEEKTGHAFIAAWDLEDKIDKEKGQRIVSGYKLLFCAGEKSTTTKYSPVFKSMAEAKIYLDELIAKYEDPTPETIDDFEKTFKLGKYEKKKKNGIPG